MPMRQEIPWSRVMGMRDHIAHGYFDIDADVVFQTIKNSKFMCLSRHERNWRKTLPSRMNTAFVCRISDMKLIENQSKCRPIAAPIS